MYAYVKRTRNGKYLCEILRNNAWLTDKFFNTEKQARKWDKEYINAKS